MRTIFLLSFCFIAFSAHSQIETDRNDLYLLDQQDPAVEENSDLKNRLNFGIGFHLNSNAITNDFIKGLLYQGFIDNNRKDLVTDRLKEVNRGGYDFNAGLSYQYQAKPDLAIVIGLNQRQQFNVKFPKDLFELVFRGNKQFVDKKANIGPLALNFFDYQSLFLGVQKNINSNFIIGGGLSFIRGGQFNTLRIDRGTLYTAADGSYLDFDMKFKLAFSESENFLTSNGIGLAANWNASFIQEKGRLNFEIRDLGFIRWSNLKTYEGDSIYRYEGIEVNDVLTFSDSIFSQIKADSIAEDLGIKGIEKDFTYTIPATFHVNYVHYLSEKITMVGGVKYMLRAAYIPRVYVKGLYYFNDNFFIAPVIAYGGFGRLDFELGAAKSFNDKLIISANAFYLEYVLLPKKSSGQGFNFSVTKLF
jgi:hypothetical protein